VLEAKIPFPRNYLQHHVVYSQNLKFLISLMSKDYIFFQAPCQIFVERLGQFGSPSSHSIDSDIHSHFIYLTCHAVLLPLVLVAFCICDTVMSYRRSKYVIELDEFESPNF
jgi:hypothetical protein